MSKKILGLDLGTNSIGWALIEIDHENAILKIIALGSRIIPMDGQEFSKYNAGQKIESAAGNRTRLHRARITKERYLLRRDRLHLVLNLLEALPEHYKLEIDFEKNGKRCGKFKEGSEPKIAYLPNNEVNGKAEFYFEDAFNEMIQEMKNFNPEIRNEKSKRIPKDWTIYFLRNKALTKKISLEELAWVLLSYNQKRGYEQIEVEHEKDKSNEITEKIDLKVIKVEYNIDENGQYFEITLNDARNFRYKEYTSIQYTFENDIKEVVKISKLDEAGNIIQGRTMFQVNDLYELYLSKISFIEINEQVAKFKYDFEYTNGWKTEKKTKKINNAYLKISQGFENEGNPIKNLYKVSNNYSENGTPEKLIPNIKSPDFTSEGSRDWTLLKKKTEKDAIAFNISNGFVDKEKKVKHFISPKIYNVLINDAKTGERTKIVGGLFQTIDRKFYREELYQIVETQRKFHHETLDDKMLFEKCVALLYPNNANHSKHLFDNKKAIAQLLVDDILLYQRPLKSKKSEISNCKYEIQYWKDEVNESTGEIKGIPIYKKVVPVSHPIYQEFRIWDKIHNIKLIQLESEINRKPETNVDVTKHFFKSAEDYQSLFNYFNNRALISMDGYLDFCKNHFKIDIGTKNDRKFVWNYPIEEEFKGNETRKSFEIRFKRSGFKNYNQLLTSKNEIKLWHYLYSVNFKDRNEIGKSGKSSLHNFFKKFFDNIEVENIIFEKICADFSNYPKLDGNYAAYSEKALKKLISVMRIGDNFITNKISETKNEKQIVDRSLTILEKIKTIDWHNEDPDFSNIVMVDVCHRKGELPFPKGLFNVFQNFSTIDDFQFLNLTQASYLMYGRHSELAFTKYWDSPIKIREEIRNELKHHSLNNPVAEKVLKEMMKVVADIWENIGQSEAKYFSEIHLEVARELQKSSQEKAEIAKNQYSNKAYNNRIRYIIEEFLSKSPYNARKGNYDHFERLKIIEDSVKFQSSFEKDFFQKNNLPFSKKDIDDILKKQKISNSDFEKYKLWVEQGYKSPYTNKMISLSELFDGSKYNIDHIFPRAIVTNDSLNNKVVCEAFLNRFKSDKTGRGFISDLGGRTHIIYDPILKKNVTFRLINEESYVDLVKKQFTGGKRFILLSKEVPSGFTESQLNTTKHIARKAIELLSHIVRENGEVELKSKNVLTISGAITDRMKKEWHLNQVWNELLIPRFERLNAIKNTNDFGKPVISKSGHPYFDINTSFVLEQNKDFDIKRLDHRHHALDALVVALCTHNHIQYLNNENSGITKFKKDKLQAIIKQREGIKRQIMFTHKDQENPEQRVWKFMKPGSIRMKESTRNGIEGVIDIYWSSDKINIPTKDYKNVILNTLQNSIVTFKNDFKLVTKSSNKYLSYYDKDGDLRLFNGKPLKKTISQKYTNNKHWSIRKPLHQDNPRGLVIVNFDVLRIVENLSKSDLIIDDTIKDRVKEIIGICNNKIGDAKNYLNENPILIENEIVEKTAFKIKQKKYRKRQPITDLAKRTGTGKIESLEQMLDKINKVIDFKLREDLINHLKSHNNDIDIAFCIEGIDEFNSNRKIPVKRLPIAETGELRFQLGNKGNNSKKWVEAEQYTNLFFKITKRENKVYYETIQLKEAVKNQKSKLINKNETDFDNENVFFLSPNDIVFVPTIDELKNIDTIDFANLNTQQLKRIYKFVSCTSSEAHFVPYATAFEIIKNENGTNSKSERLQNYFDNNCIFDEKNKPIMIKEFCIKLKVDRLGNISLDK